MALVPLIKKIGVGAGVAVVAVTALPVAGAVGTITATGAAVASVIGGIAGAVDHIREERAEASAKKSGQRKPSSHLSSRP